MLIVGNNYPDNKNILVMKLHVYEIVYHYGHSIRVHVAYWFHYGPSIRVHVAYWFRHAFLLGIAY